MKLQYITNKDTYRLEGGEPHSLDGPAVKLSGELNGEPDNLEIWSQYGQGHRVDGPAIIKPKKKTWAINGVTYKKERLATDGEFKIVLDEPKPEGVPEKTTHETVAWNSRKFYKLIRLLCAFENAKCVMVVSPHPDGQLTRWFKHGMLHHKIEMAFETPSYSRAYEYGIPMDELTESESEGGGKSE